MDAVKPRYALPFASNHCHLLPEVDEFNVYVSIPSELEDFLNNADDGVTEWKFVRALPGSKWDSDSGFDLANQDAFIDYEKNWRPIERK